MDAAEFLSTVHKHLTAMLADGELGMTGYAWALKDGSADKQGVTILALDLNPEQSWLLALMTALEPDTQMLIFGLDRNGKPDQGTTLGDLVAGFFYERGERPRPFVVEYTVPPLASRVLWFNWHNPFWTRAIGIEMDQARRVLCDELSRIAREPKA